jgi:hypothetical protein
VSGASLIDPPQLSMPPLADAAHEPYCVANERTHASSSSALAADADKNMSGRLARTLSTNEPVCPGTRQYGMTSSETERALITAGDSEPLLCSIFFRSINRCSAPRKSNVKSTVTIDRAASGDVATISVSSVSPRRNSLRSKPSSPTTTMKPIAGNLRRPGAEAPILIAAEGDCMPAAANDSGSPDTVRECFLRSGTGGCDGWSSGGETTDERSAANTSTNCDDVKYEGCRWCRWSGRRRRRT